MIVRCEGYRVDAGAVALKRPTLALWLLGGILASISMHPNYLLTYFRQASGTPPAELAPFTQRLHNNHSRNCIYLVLQYFIKTLGMQYLYDKSHSI